MLKTETILQRLATLYTQIPDCACTHCHQCCGPILWFKPEEINIRRYLRKNKMKYLQCSTEEFEKNGMRCPYITNDRCSIYPVRPIVCRLQGNVPELPCRTNTNPPIPKQKQDASKREMDQLVRDTQSIGLVYGTRKYCEMKKNKKKK